MIKVIGADGTVKTFDNNTITLEKGDKVYIDGKIADSTFVVESNGIQIQINGETYTINNTELFNENTMNIGGDMFGIEDMKSDHTAIIFEEDSENPDQDNIIDELNDMLDLMNTAAGEEQQPQSQYWNPQFLEANGAEGNVEAKVSGSDYIQVQRDLRELEQQQILNDAGDDIFRKRDAISENGALLDATDVVDAVTGNDSADLVSVATDIPSMDFENNTPDQTPSDVSILDTTNDDIPTFVTSEQTPLTDIDLADSINTDININQNVEIDNVETQVIVDDIATSAGGDVVTNGMGIDVVDTTIPETTTDETIITDENSDATDTTIPNTTLDDIIDNQSDTEPTTTVTVTPIDSELIDTDVEQTETPITEENSEIINTTDEPEEVVIDETEPVQNEEETPSETIENDETDVSNGLVDETPIDETSVNPNAVYNESNVQWTIEDYDFNLVAVDIDTLPMTTVTETYTEMQTFQEEQSVDVEHSIDVVDGVAMTEAGWHIQNGVWTKTITEEFTDTRTVDGDDILGVRDTDIIDNQSMLDAGYTQEDGIWGTTSSETFTNTRTETQDVEVELEREIWIDTTYTTQTEEFTDIREVEETFTNTREIQVVDVEGHYETETYTEIQQQDVEIEFTDTRDVFTAATEDEFIYLTESYVIDNNIHTEEFTNTRDVTIIAQESDIITTTETYTTTETSIVDVEREVELTRDITIVDEVAALNAGMVSQDGVWYQIEMETTPITETREALVNNQGVVTYVESETGIDAFTITATINTTDDTAGRYARLVDLRNEDGDTEFSLAFDKDGTKIRGWNAENGEQVTYDMSDKLGDGQDHTIEWQVTETSSSLIVDGEAVSSINYSSEIVINDGLETVVTPEGTYAFTGTMVETETVTFDDVEDFTNSLVYEEPYDFDFDNMASSDTQPNTYIANTNLNLDDIIEDESWAENESNNLLNELLGTDDTSSADNISDISNIDTTTADPFASLTYDSTAIVSEMLTMIEQHNIDPEM